MASVLLFGAGAKAQSFSISFYSGDNLTNGVLGTFGTWNGSPGQGNFFYPMPSTNSGVDFTNMLGYTSINDMAKSAKIWTDRSMIFYIYDSPSANTSDDYVIVRVKRAVTGLRIEWFDQEVDNADVKITYISNNGIQGKISSFRYEF